MSKVRNIIVLFYDDAANLVGMTPGEIVEAGIHIGEEDTLTLPEADAIDNAVVRAIGGIMSRGINGPGGDA